MVCDPYWNQVVVQSSFEGANGATTFSDVQGRTWTAFGNAQLTTSFPKTGTSCAVFDGNGDYFSLPTASATDCNFGTGDFTIECFVNLAAMPTSDAWPSNWSSHMGVVCKGAPGSAAGYNLVLGQTQILFNSNDGAAAKGPHGMVTGEWYHLAVSRENGALRTFVNGQVKGVSAGITTDFTYTQPVLLGTETGEGAWLNGKIDELRITKGRARYTANFTPPTAPFPTNQCTISGVLRDSTGALAKRLVRILDRKSCSLVAAGLSDAATGTYSLPVSTVDECVVIAHDVTSEDFYWDKTVLACHFDGTNGSTVFTDEKGHTLTAYGDAQISTAQSKFGGSSGYFDGTGDYLTAADNTDFALANSDFTVEVFAYVTSFANQPVIFDTRQTTTGAGATFYVNTTGQPAYYAAGGVRLTSGQAMVLNKWTHIAFVRNSGTTKIYINGTWTGQSYSDSLNITEYGCTVGTTIDNRSTGTTYHFQGYMGELRVTNGLARYTTNFIPPSKPFTNSNAAGTGTENAVILDRVTPV